MVIGSTVNTYASFSDGDFSNEDSFSEEFFAPNDEDIYDSPVLFDNEPEYQEEFTDEAQATGTQPEPDEMVENNIAFQETESQIASQVKKLLTNTNSSGRPLSEYNDPINITADFSQSAEGVVQNFFRQYGNISSKNRVWRMKYEEVLVDLLSDESFIKLYKDARLGDLEDFTYSILGEIADESSEALTSAAGKIVKIQRSTLQDMIKAQIANDTEKIYILTIIEDHTDDKNLKTACKNCMSHYFSASMDSIYEVLVDIAVSNGIKKAVAVETITNQILNQKLKQTYLTKMLQELSLGTVASTVMEILLIKDALSFLTGINARVDAYLKTVCLNYIYEATATAYGSSVNGAKVGSNEDIKNLYTMFNFALQVKQEAYKSMPSIYISSTWKKIIETDPYMKLNISMIKTFTIDNYKKVELGKLTPKCTASSITVNLNGKRNYPLSGISYLATIGYASKDKKIVSINSSGVMKGVKEGTTYVGCIVQQYGEKHNLICKVNVIKPTIKLNKKEAIIFTNGNTTLQLKATLKGQSSQITWKSSNPSVAVVDKNGRVTGKAAGKVKITATSNGVSAVCTVNVVKIGGCSWVKENTFDPLRFDFVSSKQVRYYTIVAHEMKYTTLYKISGDLLTINLVNIEDVYHDPNGLTITPLTYKLKYKKVNNIDKIYLKPSYKNVDVSKLYGFDKNIEGWYRRVVS